MSSEQLPRQLSNSIDVYNFFQSLLVDNSRSLSHRRYALQAALGTLFPDSNAFRVCLKKPIPGGLPYVVLRPDGSTSYGGLCLCGNSWGCSCCASILSEVRRKEVDFAIRHWRGERYGQNRRSYGYDTLPGKEVRMVLLTIPHGRFDNLGSLLDRFLNAFGWMKRHKSYGVLSKKIGLFGTIYVLEVTYGVNGWHPHIHSIWFFDSSDVDEDCLSAELFPLWRKAVKRFGFPDVSKSAFGIKDADFVSSYVTKFGYSPKSDWLVSHEVSKWFLKKGAKNSLTPFDLLERHLFYVYYQELGLDLDDLLVYGHTPGQLFTEFLQSFIGRHQLRWSKGLKKYFGIADLTDQEAAAQAERDGSVLEFLSFEKWKDLVLTDSRYSYLVGLH